MRRGENDSERRKDICDQMMAIAIRKRKIVKRQSDKRERERERESNSVFL